MSVHFVKATQVDEERLDEELVLLHPTTLEVKILNETAAVLWDALGEFSTVHDLASLLDEARPEVSAAASVETVTAFLAELANAGFVETREQTL
jgi:hypothetical protein